MNNRPETTAMTASARVTALVIGGLTILVVGGFALSARPGGHAQVQGQPASWASQAPVPAATPLPTDTPDPTQAPFYEVACREVDGLYSGAGCTQDDNPLAAGDVPRAFFEIENIPDGQDISATPGHDTFRFSVYYSVASGWQYLGTWHPWDGGNHNCRLGLDCAPPIFGDGHVRPGVYDVEITYGAHHLAPYTLTITR